MKVVLIAIRRPNHAICQLCNEDTAFFTWVALKEKKNTGKKDSFHTERKLCTLYKEIKLRHFVSQALLCAQEAMPWPPLLLWPFFRGYHFFFSSQSGGGPFWSTFTRIGQQSRFHIDRSIHTKDLDQLPIVPRQSFKAVNSTELSSDFLLDTKDFVCLLFELSCLEMQSLKINVQ